MMQHGCTSASEAELDASRVWGMEVSSVFFCLWRAGFLSKQVFVLQVCCSGALPFPSEIGLSHFGGLGVG